MTVYIPDHVQRMLDGRLPEWRDSTNVGLLIRVLAEKIQEAEDVYSDLILLRLLTTAAGSNLDQYGDLVGFGRGNLVDDEYRRLITGKILANRKGHLASQIGNIAAIFFNAPGAHYIHLSSAAFQIQVPLAVPPSIELALRAFAVIEQNTTAGVGISSIDIVDPVSPFRLDIGPGLDVGELGGILAP